MSAAKHTPGPLFVHREPHIFAFSITTDISPTKGYTVASVTHGRHIGEAEANAHLYKAAPQLLEALQRFVNSARSWHDFHHESEDVRCDWLCDCIEPGEAAIAAATGGNHG